MIEHLAVVTTETLPTSRSPCAGGGVRIWGLTEALKRNGIRCTFLAEERTQSVNKPTQEFPIHFFKPEQLSDEIRRLNFDAALFEQWQPMTFLQSPLEIPIVVDLPGPLILEYYWRDRENLHQHIIDKIDCLSRADYFLCAHERQKGYYTAWLAWAGLSPEEPRLAVVPFTLHEMPQSRQGHVEDEPLFFWGGMFWPWQDRTAAFHLIVETLSNLRRGQLVVVGADVPSHLPSHTQEDWSGHPHVSFLGALPFSEYVAELKRASVAVDLCRPTDERRLASDLRTGTALWAGTPCLVTPDSPWAEVITTHNAGWVIPYEDEKTLRTLVKEIALERVDLVAKRLGARVISESISGNERIADLLTFLRNPVTRVKNRPFFETRFEDRERRLKTIQDELDRHKHENACLQHDLNSIRSNPLFKWYKKITGFWK